MPATASGKSPASWPSRPGWSPDPPPDQPAGTVNRIPTASGGNLALPSPAATGRWVVASPGTPLVLAVPGRLQAGARPEQAAGGGQVRDALHVRPHGAGARPRLSARRPPGPRPGSSGCGRRRRLMTTRPEPRWCCLPAPPPAPGRRTCSMPGGQLAGAATAPAASGALVTGSQANAGADLCVAARPSAWTPRRCEGPLGKPHP